MTAAYVCDCKMIELYRTRIDDAQYAQCPACLRIVNLSARTLRQATPHRFSSKQWRRSAWRWVRLSARMAARWLMEPLP